MATLHGARFLASGAIADEHGFAKLTWKKIAARTDWATLSSGCYLLRTNVNDWSKRQWRVERNASNDVCNPGIAPGGLPSRTMRVDADQCE